MIWENRKCFISLCSHPMPYEQTETKQQKTKSKTRHCTHFTQTLMCSNFLIWWYQLNRYFRWEWQKYGYYSCYCYLYHCCRITIIIIIVCDYYLYVHMLVYTVISTLQCQYYLFDRGFSVSTSSSSHGNPVPGTEVHSCSWRTQVSQHAVQVRFLQVNRQKRHPLLVNLVAAECSLRCLSLISTSCWSVAWLSVFCYCCQIHVFLGVCVCGCVHLSVCCVCLVN